MHIPVCTLLATCTLFVSQTFENSFMKADRVYMYLCVCGFFSVAELDFGPSHSHQVSVKDYIKSRNNTTSLHKHMSHNVKLECFKLLKTRQ